MTDRICEISVLTAVYNGERYMAEAIESILAQDFSDFEFIVVDDGSNDNTMEIFKCYAAKDPRLIPVQKSHTGIADSLNIGLRKARGTWIAKLDSDDMALPQRLGLQMDFVNNHPDVVLLGGGCIEIDEKGEGKRRYVYPCAHSALMRRLESIEKSFFPHSTAFFQRAFALECGGYHARFSRAQDGDLWLRMGERGRMACLFQPVIKLRSHSCMVSNTDQGRLQAVMGNCALICHYRRIKGLSDPSQASDEVWQKFYTWVEQQLEAQGFMDRWVQLKEYRASGTSQGGFGKWMRLSKEFAINPSFRGICRRHLFGDQMALRLAQESQHVV